MGGEAHGEHETGSSSQAEHQERAEGGPEQAHDLQAPEGRPAGLGTSGRRCETTRRSPGRALEDRTREQLYEQAKKEGISGRSRMGKWDLIEALRRSR